MKESYQIVERITEIEGKSFNVIHKVPALSAEEYSCVKQEIAKKLFDIFSRFAISASSKQK